jgi:cytochrome o ubiquinol oxidase subunit 2
MQVVNKKVKIGFLIVVVGGFLTLSGWYLHHTNIPVLEPKGIVGIKERQLILFALALSLLVVIPVFTLLFVFAWRYREGNTKAKYSPNLKGSRIAETIWWLIPTAIIIVLSVVTWNSSHALDPYKALASTVKPIDVQVVALDWKWLFIYPQQNIASVNLLQFPVGTPIDFNLTSDSVMNSFWIPQLGGQIYAMPGMSTELHLSADQTGDFNGSSANISGDGFSSMNFIARSSTQQAFDAWVQSVKHSTSVLTMATYSKLAAPSEHNDVSYYSSEDHNLYDTIVLKYMSPMGGAQNLNNYGSQPVTESE